MDAARREKATLCTDGKSHYVVVTPNEHFIYELHYGDGKKFYEVALPPHRTLDGLYFLDPRLISKTGNPDFRGVDVRRYSAVEFDPQKKTCSVRCGDRVTQLSILDAAKAKAILDAAKFEESPMSFEPHAFARDDKGTYYYVDKGIGSKNKGKYRLFRGPKGDLKLQSMTNVVSDSEGEIFATKTGSLRLIFGRQETLWVEGDVKRTKLTAVPVADNTQLIYNELGVYTGQSLGTPCDHL